MKLPRRTILEEETENLPQNYIKNIPKEIHDQIDWKNMRHYWYPIELSSKITKEKPIGIHLLNEPLVFFRSKDGKINCAQDLCPHRSARLSLGNMKDGNLECQYHGWQFGIDGKCEKVPAVSKESKFHQDICLNTKPCVESMGLIWVWVGPPKLAHESLIPKYIFQERNFNGWRMLEFSQDLDLRFDLMIDNLVDAAHLDFTHDGYLGKRENATFVKYEEATEDEYLKANPETISYFVKKPEFVGKSTTNSQMTFIPPCFIKLRSKFESGWFMQTIAVIPTTKKTLRILDSFDNNVIPRPIIEFLLPTKLGQFFLMRTSNAILMQDYEMLKGINDNTDLNAKVYSKIINADIMIKKYRDWSNEAFKKDPWFKGFQLKDIEEL
jgi:phenylpropionate dioxygenase-like ring-hydroxylating dioxygenase large terminal subunit